MPFTETHDAFRSLVRRFAEQELAPHIDEWEADEFPAREVMRRAGELGILGAHYPENVGGSGGDYWHSIAKSEELPRCGMAGVTMALLVQSDMATPVIADLGSSEQIEEFLVPALRGEKVAALAVTEPGAGSDVAAIVTRADRDGTDWLIRGQKTFITNGAQCDFVTVLVKTLPDAGAYGCSFFLVPTQTPGVTVARRLRKIGNHSSDTAELFFDDVRVPARALIGEENRGFMYLMQNFQTERLIACSSGCANAALALERTLEYGRARMVMGKPLLKREYWQHRFVDHLTQLEAARSLTYRAVESYNADKYPLPPGAPTLGASERGGAYQPGATVSLETVKLVSMSKVFVGELVSRIFDDCLQFHGGSGYVEEGWVARGWRDQRLLRIGGGATEVMRYYLAKLLGM